PVNTACSKTTVNYPSLKSKPFKRGDLENTRTFNKFLANRSSIFNKKVNTVRVNDSTARERAVVSGNISREVNAVKALACLDKMVLSDASVSVTEVFLFWRSSECNLLSSGISFLQQGELSLLAVGTFSSRIENQLDCKVKFIRYDNGTKFKNSVMNQFCKDKEVVNIDCYVLNRALVTKPYNKKPYELIHGRPPLIDFMKPFGCLVIILNNKDSIGEFNGKADEGYFVWETHSRRSIKKNMTRKKCYLTDFKAYDGGFVLFGDGKGRISGKGKIKTGKLDFDDVYFCKKLKYNMFKRKATQSLLVIIVDFSRFSCVFFLATKGETSRIFVRNKMLQVIPTASEEDSTVSEKSFPLLSLDKMVLSDAPVSVTEVFLFWRSFEWEVFTGSGNALCILFTTILKTFITGLENQLDCKVKFIRYDNGTKFKNSVINQFCKDKGIKREYSVAKTPQQNEVAMRRNKTLIEAARTMLVDSKLPTTFWAEVVNTDCYVLNRALVTKPHNKTPYELINGRPPLIDFMKTFGCPVIILNIKDNLGKFNGKADEGYFVWYSVVIVIGNQTNGIARSKENLVVGQDEKKKELKQEYIMIPICTTNLLISQGTKDNAEDAGKKAGEVNASEASDNGGHDYQVPRSEIEILLQQERQTAHNNNTNGINTISSPVSTAGQSFVNTASPSPINDAGPSARTNAFEVHSFERFFLSKLHFLFYMFLRNKKDERGIVIKNKARLVTQEHTQEEGIDYDEVFTPVVRIEAIRLFLAYNSFKDFVVYQLDVKSDFIYGKIEEEVHVCQPPGFEDLNFPNFQAPRARLMIAKDMRCFMDTSEVTTGNPLLNTARLMLILLDRGKWYRKELRESVSLKTEREMWD
nr:hypothetical protein [Tanacetum cinerariifolium]